MYSYLYIIFQNTSKAEYKVKPLYAFNLDLNATLYCSKKYLARISVEGALPNTINYHTRLKPFTSIKTFLPALSKQNHTNKSRTLTLRLGVEKENIHFSCVYTKCPRETCYRHCFTILKSGRWASDRVTFFVTENTNTHTHTPLVLSKAMKRELGYDFEPTLRGALGSLELLHVISKHGGSAE